MKNIFMQPSLLFEHSNIAIYGDDEFETFSKNIGDALKQEDIRICLPDTLDTLLEASQNCALILICLDTIGDSYLHLAQRIRADHRSACEIVAVARSDNHPALNASLLLMDYDMFIALSDFTSEDLSKILLKRISYGSQKLSKSIQEEEYRRFRDALSCAPASVMVFDEDKRIVFVSDHYFRVYPKSAPRLIRGMSVFEAFDMMSQEEKLEQGGPLFLRLKSFWHNLDGEIEFTLDNGMSYRLTAVRLPNQSGAIVTGQNISPYVEQRDQLSKALAELSILSRQ